MKRSYIEISQKEEIIQINEIIQIIKKIEKEYNILVDKPYIYDNGF